MQDSQSELISQSEDQTLGIASNLAQSFRGNEVVLLEGELGAGKTVFAKGLCSGLGVEDVHQVCSPSYTLVNIYEGKYTIYHMDLYRLGGQVEIDDLGWEDYLGEGVVIVEWADKIEVEIESIRVRIEVLSDSKRKIILWNPFAD